VVWTALAMPNNRAAPVVAVMVIETSASMSVNAARGGWRGSAVAWQEEKLARQGPLKLPAFPAAP
jgi:hypothetical protein